MGTIIRTYLLTICLLAVTMGYSQVDRLTKDTIIDTDSANIAALKEYSDQIVTIKRQHFEDSVRKAELETQISKLKTADSMQKEQLVLQLKTIEDNAAFQNEKKRARIDALRLNAVGYPVIGAHSDTLFAVYSKTGAFTPRERSVIISRKIAQLYEDDYFNPDSVLLNQTDNSIDIVYGETIIVSISETDALWYDSETMVFASECKRKIQESVVTAKEDNSLLKIFLRIGLVLLVAAFTWGIFILIDIAYNKLRRYILHNKDKWLRDLSYKDYTFLSSIQELRAVMFLMKIIKGIIYVALLYICLPVIFSIFPFSRDWADALFQLIWSPFKGVLHAVWNYIPNLFSILVIFYVIKYFIKFIEYIFSEISAGKLVINGFHLDWAMPTFSIVRFLMYAFMFVMIFPYLPGSDSNIFKGVSVFIGILFSLGSSSAISNMVAGLVITYMRPFKIGDRIKIGEVTGDVIEKTLLVTRIKSIKNEIITIPNSSVLSGNTTNYSSDSMDNGLIVHTTITIGYDVPWRDMHRALLEAADRTELLQKDPQPFVLQTGLEDFYVSYQINAYTQEASRQAYIYSLLHQNIQDLCNENGIEILSPHYRAARDGNSSTIPANYLPKDYTPPRFGVDMNEKPSS